MRYKLVATFADGYKYRVNKKDQSIFDPEHNGFWDILHPLPEIHGPCVRIGLSEGRLKKLAAVVDIPSGEKPFYEVDREADFQPSSGQQVGPTRNLRFRVGYKTDFSEEIIQIEG